MLGRFLGKGKGKNKDKNEESTPQEPAAIPDSEDRTMLGMQSPMAPPAQAPIAQPAPTGVPPQPVAPPPVATAPPPAPEGGGNEDRTMLGMQSPIAPPAQAPVAQPMPTGVPPTPVATPPPVAATPPPAPNAGGNEDRTMLGMQSPIAPPAQAPVAQPMPTGVPATPVAPPVATPPPIAATPPPAQNAGGNEDRTMLGMQSPIAPPAQAPVAQPVPAGVQPAAPTVATPPVTAVPDTAVHDDRTMLGAPSPMLSKTMQIPSSMAPTGEVVACSTDTEQSHWGWLQMDKNQGGIKGVTYPVVADTAKTIATNFGVLTGEYSYNDQDELVASGAMIALRGLFLIDKKGTIHHQLINNFPLGRNVNEALRMVDALQHFEAHGEVCPANWQKGDEAMVETHDGVANYLSSH